MEMMMVKDEGYRGRRRFCMADGADVQAVRCVKRRRRDRASDALGRYDDNQGSHQEPNEQPNTSATTVKRSSKFRGVSRHRWTGRYEAHLWDTLSWNVTQQKKGKQVYLGAYYDEEDAARTYDLAALKYWGTSTSTNFPISDYEKEIEIMQTVTKEEYLASLRRKSNGFSRGVSKYRGVARHHQNGRWEARIGKVIGNKYLHLGTYSTQEEAARAYDIAAIEYRGINAVTNFDLSTYIRFSEPGTGNLVAANELLAMAADQPELLQLTTSYSPIDESKPSLYHSFHTDYFNSRRKQQVFESRSPVCVNSCNNKSSSSSPTALGLLLRSSIFRELVEKNANMSEDESINDEPKKQEAGRDDDGDEFSGVFYDVTDDFPLICLSGEDSSIELQAKRELPSFYDTYIYTHTHTKKKQNTMNVYKEFARFRNAGK